MPISESQLALVQRVKLPAYKILEGLHKCLDVHHVIELESVEEATATPLKKTRGIVKHIQVNFLNDKEILVNMHSASEQNLFDNARFVLEVDDCGIEGNTLVFSGKCEWKKHPKMLSDNLECYRARINSSWENAIKFTSERFDSIKNELGKGFRPPQIGALHALAAHWIVDGGAALIVMPTGTGKTEVMLASLVIQQTKSALVLVPSDSLREQTFSKLRTLGILSTIGVLSKEAILPIVGIIKHTPTNIDILSSLKSCNVVISTVAMLINMPDVIKKDFFNAFDTVYFDEAHHLPAKSWMSIHEFLLTKKVIQFTATPFRSDGKRIPGRIIFNFPLHLAQDQGYFQKIKFLEVNEIDSNIADEKIAAIAVGQLEKDLKDKYEHIILARTDTKLRAEELYKNIYNAKYAYLNPIIIHTGISGRQQKLKSIRQGIHKIIICVDMFGEGFDLPALKIAAMHNLHASLAITLQFIGRFTRSASNIGAASLVANIGDVNVSETIEDLYAEDADWNKLIPELSSKAIQSEIDFKSFLDIMTKRSEYGADSFGLNMLRPKTSTVIYRVSQFNYRNFNKTLEKDTTLKSHWISDEKTIFIAITKTVSPIEWAKTRETSDEIWDIYILFHDVERNLLFIHSSQKSALYDRIAKSVSGETRELFSGEKMFRVFSGIERLILLNAGLYGYGKLRFRMYTGLDVTDAISPSQQLNSTKSNLFAIGYEKGKRVSIGASQKGRIWAMSSSSIPDWQNWCRSIADKITDETIPTNAFLQHTLSPEEISQLPEIEILSVLLPDEWFKDYENISHILVYGHEIPIIQFEIIDWKRIDKTHIYFAVSWGDSIVAKFEISWGAMRTDIGLVQLEGPKLEIQIKNSLMDLTDYFRENIPVLLLMDGSEVKGKIFFKRANTLQFSYPKEAINILSWGDTQITQESKWKNGLCRSSSVQGYFIDERKKMHSTFLIDDDDTGEASDIVEIIETGVNVTIRLFHCKFSGAEESGSRAKDLYEVCGQAVRSIRWVDRPEVLLKHLERRESVLNGRTTRFEKGTLKELRALRKRLSRRKFNFEIAIVQPGLSVANLTEDHSSVLGSADNYIREFTGSKLLIYGSA